MIATIEGTVSEKLNGLVIIQAGGIGYGFYVAPEDQGQLKVGSEAKLYVHEHIRENAYDLYGFSQVQTKQLFEQLLDVNGVGPKMALAILSTGTSDEVRSSIAAGDTKSLQAAPGVGKRVAERVVVDLKDKVGLIAADNLGNLLKAGSNIEKDEAAQALIALGFRPNDAAEALEGVDSKLPTQERVKQALKAKS